MFVFVCICVQAAGSTDGDRTVSLCEVCHHSTTNLRQHMRVAHPGCARPWMAGVCGTLIGEYCDKEKKEQMWIVVSLVK